MLVTACMQNVPKYSKNIIFLVAPTGKLLRNVWVFNVVNSACVQNLFLNNPYYSLHAKRSKIFEKYDLFGSHPQRIKKRYPRCIHSVSKKYPPCIHNISKIYPWIYTHVSMDIYPWNIHRVSTIYLKNIHGYTHMYPWIYIHVVSKYP